MQDQMDLINTIVRHEWLAFINVQNIGGKADCQDDPETFKIMRTSQFISWPNNVLESYLNDLLAAEANGRNLISEKYAWMMKSTSPAEYARIEHLLPRLGPEVTHLIEKIMEIELAWQEDILKEFPYVIAQGRPLYSSQDNSLITSFETYLRSELATYSNRTLELYYKNRASQYSQNINGAKMTLEYTVKHYGYQSLADANGKKEGPDTDLTNLNHACAVFKSIGSKIDAARCLNDIALTHIDKQEYRKAYINFNEALSLFREIGSREGEANQWGNIGSTLRDLNQNDEALKAYSEAAGIFKEIKNKMGVADQLTNIGYILSLKGDFNGALKHYQEALPLYKELEAASKTEMTQRNIDILLKKVT